MSEYHFFIFTEFLRIFQSIEPFNLVSRECKSPSTFREIFPEEKLFILSALHLSKVGEEGCCYLSTFPLFVFEFFLYSVGRIALFHVLWFIHYCHALIGFKLIHLPCITFHSSFPRVTQIPIKMIFYGDYHQYSILKSNKTYTINGKAIACTLKFT